MGSILLVTGSRALTDTPAAREWARAALTDTPAAREWAREALRAQRTPNLSRVVAGDARGPDEWAHCVWSIGAWLERWCLDGDVRLGLASEWWTERCWLPADAPRPSSREAWAARALARNQAMVEDVARRGNARCLALLAPWSRTRGTQHTLHLAREHGIPVEVLVCPAEHGPRGAR